MQLSAGKSQVPVPPGAWQEGLVGFYGLVKGPPHRASSHTGKVSSLRLTSALNWAPAHLCPTTNCQAQVRCIPPDRPGARPPHASPPTAHHSINANTRPWHGEGELWGPLQTYLHSVPTQIPWMRPLPGNFLPPPPVEMSSWVAGAYFLQEITSNGWPLLCPPIPPPCLSWSSRRESFSPHARTITMTTFHIRSHRHREVCKFPKGTQLPVNRAQVQTRSQTLQNPDHILSFLGLP